MNSMSPYSMGFDPRRDPNLSQTVTIPREEYEAMKRKLHRLEHAAMLESWRTNPDRMGL